MESTKTEGWKYKVGSNQLRIFLRALDFTKILCVDDDGKYFWNGTAYASDTEDGQGHRIKIKNAVMEEIIFEQSAQDSVGFAKNPEKLLEVMDRCEKRWYDVELMYAFSEKRASEAPALSEKRTRK